jgi:hypothetical protein
MLPVLNCRYEKDRIDKRLSGRASLATQDYLDNHVDHRLLTQLGVEPGKLKVLMLEASYKKDLDSAPERMNGVDIEYRHVIGHHYFDWGDVELPKKGVLSTIFPLAFLRDRLGKSLLRTLLEARGIPVFGNVFDLAWGAPPVPLILNTFVPYNDARTLGRCYSGVNHVYSRYRLAA